MKRVICLTIPLLLFALVSFGQLTSIQVIDSINTRLADNTTRNIKPNDLRKVLLTLVNYTSTIAASGGVDLSNYVTQPEQNSLAHLGAQALTRSQLRAIVFNPFDMNSTVQPVYYVTDLAALFRFSAYETRADNGTTVLADASGNKWIRITPINHFLIINKQ